MADPITGRHSMTATDEPNAAAAPQVYTGQSPGSVGTEQLSVQTWANAQQHRTLKSKQGDQLTCILSYNNLNFITLNSLNLCEYNLSSCLT